MTSSEKIAAVPAGEWVSTLSKVVSDNGYPVELWIRNPESLTRFQKTHTLVIERSGVERLTIKMPENVTASADLDGVLDGAKRIIYGPDSVHYRELAEKVAPRLGPKAELLSVTKGLEQGTSLRMSQVLLEVDPSLEFRSAYLSGPTLAKEVVKRVETSTAIASYDADLQVSERFKKILSNSRFRVVPNPDVIGVELGGALKNIYSMAAGIEAYFAGRRGVAGNRHAMLLTASLAEMVKIGEALGAEPMTFTGLSGLGDLELGFMGKTRNFDVGSQLARRKTREQIQSRGILYEGLNTLPAIYDLVQERGIDAPIVRALYGLVFEEMKILDAVNQFMDMDVKDEYSGRRSLRFNVGRVFSRVRQTIP